MTKRTASKIVASTTAQTGADPREELFDPALRAINEHRKATRIFDEAVTVEGDSFSNARLNKATRKACDVMFAAARSMVTTQPTTTLGDCPAAVSRHQHVRRSKLR
jgi:hypothetical protein